MVFAGLSASGNASAGPNTQSTTSPSIRYYHVILVGVICFLIGAITSFVILVHCHQRISVDYKPPSVAAAVAMSTAEKRNDVIVTSGGGVATLQTVIGTANAGGEKLRRTNSNSNDGGDDVFSPARSSVSNGTGSSQTALVHLRQYYRRHYTGGVADTTYMRS